MRSTDVKGRAGGDREVTDLLRAWSDGDRQALDELMPLVHDRLSRLASSFLRNERVDHTFETSSLVNEAYLRLVDQDRATWRDRAHFFAIAGRVMRRILVDHSRRRQSAKRGGAMPRVSLETARARTEAGPEVLRLDGALATLERSNRELARLVELRYFGGLTREETAAVMGISTATVVRRWRLARAWLHCYLVEGELLEV